MTINPSFSLFDADPGAAGGGAPAAPVSTPSAAPSAPAPSTGSGESAFDSLLSATLNAPNSPAVSSAPAESAAPTDAGAGSPAEGQTAAPAVPATAPAGDAAAAAQEAAEKIATSGEGEASPDDPLAEFNVDDDTEDDAALADPAKPNLLDLKKPRGQRIYRSYKAYKEMAEALGHEPTTEDVRGYFEAFSDQAAMADEFNSGDPTKAANFAVYWNNLNPQSMATMAGQLPELMVQVGNTQAYMAMAVPVINRYLAAKYSEAASNRDPKMREAWTYVAQMIDHDLNGSYRPSDKLQAQPATNPQLDAQAAQVQQGLQQIRNFEQQQAAQANQNFVSQVDAAKDSALDAAVEPIMKSLKATLPSRVFNATAKDFKDTVKQHVAKDADGQRLYDLRLNQALRSKSSPDRDALVGMYTSRVSRAIRALAPAFLKEAGVAAAAQNAQTHQQLAQQAKAGAAPNSAGRPVQSSIAPPPQQYASQGAKMDAMLESLLGPSRKA